MVVNGAFSFVQEYRAERATRALAALLPEEATAPRDGRKRLVSAAELLPGDVLLLVEGDRVSVDARVLQSDDLKVDNAALTGESEPVPRGVGRWRRRSRTRRKRPTWCSPAPTWPPAAAGSWSWPPAPGPGWARSHG